MRFVTYIDARDCDPPHGLDMESAHDRDKVNALARSFAYAGFDHHHPALVGYPLDGRVQLLSGTHRHMAALLTGAALPVTLWLRSDIEAGWGDLPRWSRIMADIPTDALLRWTREDRDA